MLNLARHIAQSCKEGAQWIAIFTAIIVPPTTIEYVRFRRAHWSEFAQQNQEALNEAQEKDAINGNTVKTDELEKDWERKMEGAFCSRIARSLDAFLERDM